MGKNLEITIRMTNQGINVAIGDRSTGDMSFGEMVEQLIGFGLASKNAQYVERYRMDTAEGWEAYWKAITANTNDNLLQ
jgi:hypothetical protein